MFHEVAAGDGAARVRAKICGITNFADAAAAVDCGADAIGVNFFRGSRRYLDPQSAREWLCDLPRHLAVVAVVVNASLAKAVEIGSSELITALQLHGQETPEFCRELLKTGVPFAKALPVSDSHSLVGAREFSTRTLVLDSCAGGTFGGTGSTFPWQFAAEYVSANPDMRIVLAGGLSPDNVAAAVAIVRPFAVDVTSGVERAAGRKDHGLIRAFIAAAHAG